MIGKMMSRKIPIPQKIQSNSFFTKYSTHKNKEYACSMTVRDIVLHESNSEEYKFDLIFELIHYLFMIYNEYIANEQPSKYYMQEDYQPNMLVRSCHVKNSRKITFEQISLDIQYYSDRWSWWRVWAIYRQTVELKRKIELKEK